MQNESSKIRKRIMTSLKNHRDAYFGILLLGTVSLMGDIIYEGARGIVPSLQSKQTIAKRGFKI
jgi:hypothetical protein